MSYKIFTESTASLTDELINKYDVKIITLYYYMNNVEYKGYENGKNADMKEFYKYMRTKADVHTACANSQAYYDAFKPILESGEDILYIGFSEALSRTYESAVQAITELKKQFPDRKIIAVSSLCACFGQGKLVITACENLENGMSIEDNQKFLEEKKLHLIHLFTVDDLFYLYRGGRISALSYRLGKIVNIKPVMHVDNEGRLVAVSKVFTRKRALLALVDLMAEKIVDPEKQNIYICHGDCMDDVNFVIEKIKERIPVKDFTITYCSSVIGSHSGPGTLAIFFYGNER